MQKHFVWLDCDTGTDDAAAILCANQIPELQIVGISAVAGNVELEKTYLNVHRLNRLMQTDYPVYRGADKPLYCKAETGYRFHGENGLGGVELPLPEVLPETDECAWDALYRTAAEYGGELELLATGPLTNIATAFRLHPALKSLLKRIVIMGGSTSGGNRTPYAEYNIYADPHAAQEVFSAGVPLVMCGLDVTLQAVLQEADLERIGAFGTPAAHLFHRALLTPLATQPGGSGVKLHDVVPILYAAYPERFAAEAAAVRVETEDERQIGRTAVCAQGEKNVLVVRKLDAAWFVQTVTELLARYCES